MLEHEDLPAFCGTATENEASTYSAAVQRSKHARNLKHKREVTPSKRRGKPTTYILGDSMVKDITGFKMAKTTGNEEQVYVKSFSGANVNDINSHAVPALNRASPTEYYSALWYKRPLEQANTRRNCKQYCGSATEMQDEGNEIFVSGLVHRK